MLRRLDPDIRPLVYRVELELDPARKDFRGLVAIDIQFDRAATVLELHAQGLFFDAVTLVDGDTRIDAGATGDDTRGLNWFDFGRMLGPGKLTIEFAYHANYASGLEGAYRARTGRRYGVFTQFEAIGARRVIPCFDEPGFKAPFEVTVKAPVWAEVIANARQIEATNNGKVATHRFAATPPLPSYLLAFAVGEFDIVEHEAIAAGDIPRPPIPLRGIARKGRGDALAYVLSITEKLVHIAEKYFGIAYPFDKLDIIAVPDFAAGGMENAGAITYDEAYVLLDDDEFDLDRRRDMLTLHAHELVHQWFGNLVSPKWWDDLWLNESFATLLESKFSAMVEPRWHFATDILANAHGAMILDLLPSVRRVHEPVLTEDGISTAFDAITYEKGSVVLAMVEHHLGEAGFQNFISTLLKPRRFGTYDTAGFAAHLRTMPKGEEAAELLLSLIDQPGMPVVEDAARAFPGDDAPRYQQVKLSEAQWLQHCARAPSLPLPQALAIAMGFDVAFFGREMSLATYFEGVRNLSRHAMWEVAGIALENLEFLLLEMPEETRAKQVAREIFSPLFTASAPSIDMVVQWQMERRELDLAHFMAVTRCDERLFQELKVEGASRLTMKDPFASSRSSHLLGASLIALARSSEPDVFAKLALLLDDTDDAHFRGHVLEALCACPGPGIDAALERMLLGESLKSDEIVDVLDSRARFPEFRDSLWSMVSRNREALLQRLDGDMDVALIQVADVFSAPHLADQVQASITPLLGRLRGGVPQLGLTVDKIRLNAALLHHLRESKT